MEVKINSMDHMGQGISKIDDKIIFVPKSVTGDICDIDIYKTTKKYDKGRVVKIIKKSNLRIDAICPYYDICGGCNISNLSYLEQLEFKKNKVKNIFKKYLNIDINPLIIGSDKEYKYRNKITYHNDAYLGLIGEFNDIVNINKCMLVSDRVNELYELIKESDITQVKLIMIKECDNGLILSITGNMDVSNLYDKCIAIYMNNECLYHKENGYICINDIKYMISNQSFFQINTSNIVNLYDEIVRYADFKRNDKVIDLYCGVGSISLYIAKYVKSVLGIEIVKEAIEDAKKNASINGISNVEFICSDVAKVINDNLDGNTLIVDPPRIGIDKYTIDIINNSKIDKIIYVSCNPMTLVRDLKLLTNYKLTDISIVDMFPQTHHIECVALLCRKK